MRRRGDAADKKEGTPKTPAKAGKFPPNRGYIEFESPEQIRYALPAAFRQGCLTCPTGPLQTPR